MTQNRSNAVMATRAEAHDSLDDFPTPPWATRALVMKVLQPSCPELQTVWEPACNRGYMARPLNEYFGRVIATDIYDYGWSKQECTCDFLFPSPPPQITKLGHSPDWIITNPPFRLAEQFFHRAVNFQPKRGIALFVRLQWIEGVNRWQTVFNAFPNFSVHPFAERVPICKGKVNSEGSTATAYAWFVWCNPYLSKQHLGFPALQHIPPCRAQLEQPDDYPQSEIVNLKMQHIGSLL